MNLIVRDGLFSEAEVAAANDAWPADDWPGWVRYEDDRHRKMASDLATELPRPLGLLLVRMAALPVVAWSGEAVVPDMSLHGAGLHMLKPGGVIGPHLDSDVQPRIGARRALSMVLWVHDRWTEHDGGLLVMDSNLIVPASGRLALFDCRNQKHEVTKVTCKRDRRSLAMFWYEPMLAEERRRRAAFD